MKGLDRNRYDLFILARQLLARYQRRHSEFHGRELELALVLQYEAQHIPQIGQEEGIELTQVVKFCDELYSKKSPHLGNGQVWPPFLHDSHGQGLPCATTPRDSRWYKASNGQQGIGCHAQALHFWQNPDFLAEDRDLCPFRVYDGVTPLTLDQGRQNCGFDGNPCGWEPGLPKFLQVLGRNPQAHVFRAEGTLAMWQSLIPEPLPLYPLLVSLYFGQALLSPQERWLTPELFRREFHFKPSLFEQLFSIDPDQPENRDLLHAAQVPEQTFAVPSPAVVHPLPRPTGGHVVLDPEEAPRYQRSGMPSGLSHDPLLAERRRRRQLERTPAHDTVLKNFRRWFRLAGKEVREDPDSFDFLAVDDQGVLLAEIKILGQQDTAEAIQETLGQLLYYEYFALSPWRHLGYPITKAAVFDHAPLGDYVNFLWEHDIYCFWLDPEGRIDGSAQSLPMLEQMGIAIRKDPEFIL